MKRISTYTIDTLDRVAESLNSGDELTRKVVFSLHDCYGLRVLDEYVATYEPRRETLKEKASKLPWLVINWIKRAYNKIKR